MAEPHAARSSTIRGRAALRLLLVLVGLAGGLYAGERVFRASKARVGVDDLWVLNTRHYVVEGWVEGFAAHPYAVFKHPYGLHHVNTCGYKDAEWSLLKKPQVPRILCLGGSTTAGGNVMGPEGSYPHFLEQILEERLGIDVEVLNAGMSGWNSAEMLTAWFLELQDFRPDVVVIHEAVNDVEPRNHPGFRLDYSHFRKPFQPPCFSDATRWLAERSELFLWLVAGEIPTISKLTTLPARGRPWNFDGEQFPPETIAPYARNLLSIGRGVEDRGGRVVLMTLLYDPSHDRDDPPGDRQYRRGIRDNNQVMRNLSEQEGWVLCDLERMERDRPEVWEPHFLDLVHVDPEGNRLKAERLAGVLASWFDPGR